MPIQEEEKASGKPAAKARPILKPSSTSGWDITPIEQRHWIDTETQESNDPYCFQVSKFITRLLRHSQEVYREADGAVHYDQVIDECKKKQSNNTGYWSDEMKKQFVNAPHWSIYKWISVLEKRWRMQEMVSILLESELSSSILVPSSNPRTFRKYNQSRIARQCTVTEEFYRMCFPGGVSRKTGRHAVFFTFVNPMDNQDGLGETLCDLSTARIAPYKNTRRPFQNTVFCCNFKLAQQRGLLFY